MELADAEGNETPPNTCPECLEKGITKSFDGDRAATRLGAHRRGAHGIEGSKEKKAKRERTGPPKVELNLNAPKVTGRGTKDAEKVQRTAQGATSFANMVAMGLVLLNQQEDAADIAGRAAAFGKAAGDLSQYQPILHKIFAPTGEMTGEAAAWIGLALVVAGMVVPIGIRHGWVPEKFGATFGVVTSAGAAVASDAQAAAA